MTREQFCRTLYEYAMKNNLEFEYEEDYFGGERVKFRNDLINIRYNPVNYGITYEARAEGIIKDMDNNKFDSCRNKAKATLNKLYDISKWSGMKPPTCVPVIKNVIFNDPATIVFWADGTKTVVKCQEGDIYDPEKGMAMAISRKALGDTYDYYNVFKKWLKKAEEKNDVECLYPRIFPSAEKVKTDLQEAFYKFAARNFGEKVAASVKKEESTEDLRCTVCKRLRLSEEFGHYCTVDGRTIDPAKHACAYFEHETATCDDCDRCYVVAKNEEGSCVEFRCELIDEHPIDRSRPACWRFEHKRPK